MFDTTTRLVDLIEGASDAQPFCPCGWHTTMVWRDGVVWLECASLSSPRHGVISRLIAAATSPAHVHRRIVDVPAATPERVATGA